VEGVEKSRGPRHEHIATSDIWNQGVDEGENCLVNSPHTSEMRSATDLKYS